MSKFAAERHELLELEIRFDPFSDNPQTQLVCYADQPFDYNDSPVIRRQPVDERFVDLDDVDRDRQEMSE